MSQVKNQDSLKKAEEYARLIRAELIAIENKNEVLDVISSSDTVADAQSNLEARFNLDPEQSKRIVEMRFINFSRQRVNETRQAYNQALAQISELKG